MHQQCWVSWTDQTTTWWILSWKVRNWQSDTRVMPTASWTTLAKRWRRLRQRSLALTAIHISKTYFPGFCRPSQWVSVQEWACLVVCLGSSLEGATQRCNICKSQKDTSRPSWTGQAPAWARREEDGDRGQPLLKELLNAGDLLTVTSGPSLHLHCLMRPHGCYDEDDSVPSGPPWHAIAPIS